MLTYPPAAGAPPSSAGGAGGGAGGPPTLPQGLGGLVLALLVAEYASALGRLPRPEMTRLLTAAGVPTSDSDTLDGVRNKCAAAAWAAGQLRRPSDVSALPGSIPSMVCSAFSIPDGWTTEARDRCKIVGARFQQGSCTPSNVRTFCFRHHVSRRLMGSAVFWCQQRRICSVAKRRLERNHHQRTGGTDSHIACRAIQYAYLRGAQGSGK